MIETEESERTKELLERWEHILDVVLDGDVTNYMLVHYLRSIVIERMYEEVQNNKSLLIANDQVDTIIGNAILFRMRKVL